MQVTPDEGSDWREWLLTTSIPLVHLNDTGEAVGLGSGTMVDHEGRRFLVTAGHVAKLESKGWAIVVQQHSDGRMEYFKPSAFIHVGEFCRTSPSLRLLDLCAAQVPADLASWYEFRTPRGLFDRRTHHVFDAELMVVPVQDQIYGFSGRVRTEMHGPKTFVSEMTVFPGLSYAHTEVEEHHFALPVPHPGHQAFHGSSGAPICDFSRKAVAIVVGGDPDSNTIRGVAIQRVLPALHFLSVKGVTH